MGYRIDYQPIPKIRRAEIRRTRRAAFTAVCFILFLLLVSSCWPEGAQMLRSWLLPGDGSVAVAAMEELSRDLKAGQSFPGAWEVFLQRVLPEGTGG